MKTSLNIENSLFEIAQKEAQKNKKTLSETITHWARVGWETLKKQKRNQKPKLTFLNLGGPTLIDINCRRDWMDVLDS